MAIIIHRFPAAQILRVEVLPEGRSNVPFLNWRVTAKAMDHRDAPLDAFAGAGVYGVCFDDQLIYIGSFLGSGGVMVGGVNAATFSGDVARGRWWQHFGSITGRSHNLSVTPSTLEKLEREFGPDHPMVAALLAAVPDLGIDAGCLGARERLRFAARRFAEFAGEQVEPAHVLSRFCYVYVRFDELPAGMDTHELSRWVEDTETRLIESLHPEVNTAKKIPGQEPVRVDCTRVGETILEALRHVRPGYPEASSEQYEPARDPCAAQRLMQRGKGEAGSVGNSNHRPPTDPAPDTDALTDDDQRPSARELFYGSIATAPAAAVLVALVIALCEELHARDHHTYTRKWLHADLRVEADRNEPRPLRQNVVTLDWHPQAGHISCRVLLTTDECIHLGLPTENVGQNTIGQPLPTKLTVVPGPDNAALLAVIRRSIEKFRRV